LSAGDDVDVLVAFNQEAYDTHREEVREDGLVIYNLTTLNWKATTVATACTLTSWPAPLVTTGRPTWSLWEPWPTW
jgi:Pyruvate/2-oxoacid:ferredoxin oxidoreductase gamma subunit